MPRGVPKHVKGERVRTSLIAARPDGLSAKRLSDVSGLTLSQVRSGLVEVREETALANQEPLTWSRSDGYQLSDSPQVWRDYERAMATTLHARLVRLMKGTVSPHARRVPEDTWVQLITAQLNAAVASLRIVIDAESLQSPSTRQPDEATHR